MIKSFFVSLALFAFLWTPLGHTAEPATIAGKWHFVFNTDGGDREMTSIFEQTAGKVTGKWAVTDSKPGGTAVAGTFSEKQMTLEFPFDSEEGGPGTLKLKGTLADDGTLSGNWYFTDYTGTFKATRVKDEPAK